jgi:ferritin-like metal-binding protein YciE
MALDSLHSLFVDELKDILSAEKQILRAMPGMIKGAGSPKLKKAFERHREETRGQIERLESIFASLDERAGGKKCKGMEGLVEEGKEILEEDGAPEVIDAAIISAAQRIEHYEIAAYGCVIEYARLLGEKEAMRLLQQSLREEEATDKKLTALAEGGINQAALAVDPDAEEEEEAE